MKEEECAFAQTEISCEEKRRTRLFRKIINLILGISVICLISYVIFSEEAYAADLNTAQEAGKRIAAGGFHSIVLNADGTVEAWGNNNEGQCGVPEELSDITAVSAGYTFSIALKFDGTLEAWGDNTYGQCVVVELSDVAAISAGYYHALALKEDGTVVGWGWNNKGQCNITGSDNVAVAGGRLHSLALKTDGTVKAFGANGSGQCSVPSGLSNAVDVSAGYYHSVALKSDGTVEAWGNNDNNQCEVASLSGIVAVSAGGYHNLALKSDGTVVAWGSNGMSQCNVPEGLADVVAVSAGHNYSMALKSDGTLVTWGNNNQGQCNVSENLNLAGELIGLTVSEGVLTPAFDSDTTDYTVEVDNFVSSLELNAIMYGSSNQLLIDGQIQSSGDSKTISLDVGYNNFSIEVSIPSCGLLRIYTMTVNRAGESIVPNVDIIKAREAGRRISAGQNHSLALKNNGSIKAWGSNGFGKSDVPGGFFAMEVSAGQLHSLAIRTGGAIEAWGDNTYGQCDVRTGPAIAISAGYYHSLVLNPDGTVDAWGHGSKGSCNVPAGLSNVVEVSAGYYWSMALKSDGTVEAWGWNNEGQCDVRSLSDVVDISAGSAHGLALKTNGTVVAWGINDDNIGQCNVPSDLNDVVAVSAGQNHSLALKSDGTVVAWGANGKGQCEVPEGLTHVVAVSAGGNYSLALKSDGTVVAWGADNQYQTVVPTSLNLAGMLSDLSIGNGILVPDFDPDTADYALDVARSSTLEITATLCNSSDQLFIQGHIQNSGLPETISLAVGSNNIRIEVLTPSCGLSRIYMVTAKRAASKNRKTGVNATFIAGKSKEEIPVDINKTKGIVTLSLDKYRLNKAFEKAEIDGNITKTIYAEIPNVEGIDSYKLELPAEILDSEATRKIEIKSEVGSITLPGNMLEDTELEGAEKIGIQMGIADKSKLSDELQEMLNGKPLIKLKLMNGNKTIEWSNAEAPVAVSIPYTPTDEELADPEHITVWYIDGKGNVVEVPSGRYDSDTGMVTFTTTHFSNYAVAYVKKTFGDLDSVSWAKEQIEVLASKGILKGISDSTYSPQTTITRADYLYALIRTLGVDADIEGNFADINSDAYYYKEIAIAKALEITNGTGNNKFSPDASITRQDMMVLTERALRMLNSLEGQGTASDLDKFADKSLAAAYATESIASLVKEGLITGDGESINPLGNTTRAEAAVFLYRIYNK